MKVAVPQPGPADVGAAPRHRGRPGERRRRRPTPRARPHRLASPRGQEAVGAGTERMLSVSIQNKTSSTPPYTHLPARRVT